MGCSGPMVYSVNGQVQRRCIIAGARTCPCLANRDEAAAPAHQSFRPAITPMTLATK